MMAFFKSLTLLLLLAIVQGRANHESSFTPSLFFILDSSTLVILQITPFDFVYVSRGEIQTDVNVIFIDHQLHLIEISC